MSAYEGVFCGTAGHCICGNDCMTPDQDAPPPVEPLPIYGAHLDPNHLAGYLYGVIKGNGLITVERWNEAVQATEAYGRRWPPPGPLSH